MGIEITRRHSDVPERVQGYAQEKAEALLEEFPRLEHVHVILNMENRDNVAEVVVQGANKIRIEAEGKSEDNMGPAIDAAMIRAEKQLRKLRDKIQHHKGAGSR